MCVVGHEKDLVTQNGNAAVGAQFRIADQAGAGGAGIVPQRFAGEYIECVDFVRPGDEHHAAGGERRHLQAEVGERKNPFQLQPRDTRAVDLPQRTVAIGRVVSVVSEPVARLRRSPSDFARRLRGGHGSHNGVGIDAAQVSGEGCEIGGGQVRKRRHACSGIAAFQIGPQLIRGLRGDPWIHGEAGSLGRAARIVAMTGCATAKEHFLGERLQRSEQK